MALLLAAAACSMTIATPAPAQAVSTAASAYSNSATAAPKMRHARRRFMQAAIGHRRPTQDDLQPTQDDLQKIEKDNRDLDLPASQDDIIGADQVHAREEDLAERFEQDSSRFGREVRDLCSNCGDAEYARVHQRASPFYYGFNHPPMRAEARVTDRLDRRYDRLMPSSNQVLRQNPVTTP